MIRLAWVIPVNPAQELAFTATLYELGFGFLYVDGHCHYWVNGTIVPNDNYAAWRPYREGVLNDDQERMLHDAVFYDDFAHEAPGCTPDGVIDESPIEFWDGQTVNVCQGKLQVPLPWPPGLDALYAGGTDMTGPVRIEVGQNIVPDGAKIYPWPLAQDPSTYAIDYADSQSYGRSTKITDPTEVAALRALRAQAIADVAPTPGYWYGYIFVEPKGYVMSIRDDVPFADPTTGLWSPP